MEQLLDASYLRPGLVERASALGLGAVGIGIAILLAAWGISFLWRYTPPEIVVRQDKPFVVQQPEPLKIDPGKDSKTAAGEVIRREVTVFSSVEHGPGAVVTGWNYRDGSGRVPFQQYCYYLAPDLDHTSKKVDIAWDRIPSPISPGLVPDLEVALAKCQWWQR
jgi:hypothetical protein